LVDPQHSRLVLRIAASAELTAAEAEELEQLSTLLHRDLGDLGALDVGVDTAGSAPDGAKGVDVGSLAGLVVTLVSTGAAILQILQYVENWRSGNANRQAMVVAVEIGPEPVPLWPARSNPERRSGQKKARPQPARSALIIANSQYQEAALGELRSPGADATALAEVLSRSDIGGFDVDLLLEADERLMRRRLSGFFRNRHHQDLLLVHVSSHGLKSPDGQLYLAAADTELRELAATALPAAFLATEMSRTAARRVVLILDCCYSGAFGRTSVKASADEVRIDQHFLHGTGQTVLTASSATEYAIDGHSVSSGTVTPSVFTSALVEGLRTGNADLDDDGEISIDELYHYAYRSVRKAGSLQRPQKWAYGITGAVIVAKNPNLSRRTSYVPRPREGDQQLPANTESVAVDGFSMAINRVRTFADRGNTSLTPLLQLMDDSVRIHEIVSSRDYPHDWQQLVDRWRRKIALIDDDAPGLQLVSIAPMTHEEILRQLTLLAAKIEQLSSIHLPLQEFQLDPREP
jgi:uncharacterized caspase-like protein